MKKCEIKGFWRRNGGNVAVIFALMLLPVAIVVGFAIDTSRQVTADRVLQRATDIAALAAAKEYAHSDGGSAVEVAKDTFNANISNKDGDVGCALNSWTLDPATRAFTLKSLCFVPTIFGVGITGRDKMRVDSVSMATASVTTLDLVLVVDDSDSMAGPKLTALQTAAADAIDTLLASDNNVRIAVVPYGSGVNAGTYGNPALGRPVDDDSAGDGVDRVCVGERGGAEAATDAPPGIDAYVRDSLVGTECPVQEIVPLSNDSDTLRNAIGNLSASGLTTGHVGVGWAWYLLSPDWASLWPVASRSGPYGNPDELKVMVLMTDGLFNLPLHDPAEGLPDSAPEQAENLCTGMKGRGIIIYTIAFDAPPAGQTLMETCATSADHFFEAENEAELQAAYARIAGGFHGVGLVE